jgi:hypothetical protein
VIVPMWEWEVVQEARSNPVGVCRTRDDAMAALCKALLAVGQPAYGNVRELVLVDAVQERRYFRFPLYLTAVYEQGAIRWERPPQSGRRQICSGVIARGRQTLCGV